MRKLTLEFKKNTCSFCVNGSFKPADKRKGTPAEFTCRQSYQPHNGGCTNYRPRKVK
jgi:hypothetical protein